MQEHHASSPPVRWTKWHLATGGIIAALLVILFVFNPTQHRFYPRCFFKMFTNLDCPGCGGLRATHQLLHGNFRSAFAFNPLAVTALPFVIFLGFNALVALVRGKPLVRWTASPSLIVILGILVVVFTILRNVVPFR